MHTQEVAYTRLSYRAQRDRQRRQEEDPAARAPQRATCLARHWIRNRERREEILANVIYHVITAKSHALEKLYHVHVIMYADIPSDYRTSGRMLTTTLQLQESCDHVITRHRYLVY